MRFLHEVDTDTLKEDDRERLAGREGRGLSSIAPADELSIGKGDGRRIAVRVDRGDMRLRRGDDLRGEVLRKALLLGFVAESKIDGKQRMYVNQSHPL